MPHGEQTDDGLYTEGLRVVKPGDPDYDKWLEHLTYAHETYGDPIPYVDEAALSEEEQDS